MRSDSFNVRFGPTDLTDLQQERFISEGFLLLISGVYGIREQATPAAGAPHVQGHNEEEEEEEEGSRCAAAEELAQQNPFSCSFVMKPGAEHLLRGCRPNQSVLLQQNLQQKLNSTHFKHLHDASGSCWKVRTPYDLTPHFSPLGLMFLLPFLLHPSIPIIWFLSLNYFVIGFYFPLLSDTLSL